MQKLRPDVQCLMEFVSRRKLVAGDQLPSIKELAKELGIRPHAVRDTILQAQTMGLLRVEPRSGVYVQSTNFSTVVGAFTRMLPLKITEKDARLLDVLEARRLIEAELAAMAASRRRLRDLVPMRDTLQHMYAEVTDYEAYIRYNESFHLQIAEIAGNQVLLNMLYQLIELMRDVLTERQPATWRDEQSDKREADLREHEAVYYALLAGNPSAARAAMLSHLRETTESLVPQFSRSRGECPPCPVDLPTTPTS